MKIILLKDMANVGQHGAIKDVSDGYALNFLIPKGFAVQATAEKVAAHEKQMAEQEKEATAINKDIAEKLRTLDGTKVVLKAKANENGRLFKKIHKEDIADTLSLVDPEMIKELGNGIADVGEYVIHLAGAGVEAVVNFVVGAS